MQYGNGTLRLTTRQTYQLHGVLKGDLKTVFSSVIKAMGTTLGACGDVNRNVIAPSAPFKDRPEYAHAEELAVQLADLLAPQSGAYYDIWLDGEKFVSSTFEVDSLLQSLTSLQILLLCLNCKSCLSMNYFVCQLARVLQTCFWLHKEHACS